LDANGGGTILASTISDNSATGGQGYNDAFGDYSPAPGGFAAGGGAFSPDKLTITNSTLVANAATGGDGGDGNYEPGTGGTAIGGGICATDLILADSTVAGNSATAGTAGSYFYTNDSNGPVSPGIAAAGGAVALSATLTNSIVSTNTSGGTADDLSGTVNSSSANNLIGVGGGLTNHVNGNKVGFENPMLSALGNYGGPTETMVPLPGSPVVDAGNASQIPPGITTDQRGYDRISRGTVDIGATELGNSFISGVVFDDANGDGKQDNGEAGLAGITVYDDANNNGKLDPGEFKTPTNSNGAYSFSYLNPAPFKIRELLPVGWKQTTPSNNFAWTLYLGNNQTTTGLNFGEQLIAPTGGSISGTVFNDANADLKQDDGELGLVGWTVFIDTNNDGILDNGEAHTLTTASGSYTFFGLAAGTYLIRAVRPTGWSQTTPTNGFGQHITLAKNKNLTGVQFGERQPPK
jgi:hypothetical protein